MNRYPNSTPNTLVTRSGRDSGARLPPRCPARHKWKPSALVHPRTRSPFTHPRPATGLHGYWCANEFGPVCDADSRASGVSCGDAPMRRGGGPERAASARNKFCPIRQVAPTPPHRASSDCCPFVAGRGAAQPDRIVAIPWQGAGCRVGNFAFLVVFPHVPVFLDRSLRGSKGRRPRPGCRISAVGGRIDYFAGRRSSRPAIARRPACQTIGDRLCPAPTGR